MSQSPPSLPSSAAARRRPARTGRGAILLRVLIGAAVVLVAGGAVLALVARPGRTGDEAPDLHTVGRQAFDITTTASGELRARNQTTLRSTLDKEAAIVEIIEEGSRVQKGDVLVRLNSEDLESELDDETINLENARSQVVSAESALAIQISDNESALRQALLKVELAELELRKWEQGDLVEKRLELELGIEKAQREHERLKTKLERSVQLHAREFLSSDELERDRLAYIEAQSNLKTAVLAEEVYEQFTHDKDRKKLTSDLDEAKAELDRVKRKNESELATKQANLDNERRQLALREEKATKLKDQIQAASIVAPTDGLVVYATSLEQFSWMNNQEPLNVGTSIRPNQEILILPDTSEMVAAVRVSESQLGRVKPGQRATVTIDAAQGRSYAGAVESIGIMARTGGWRDPNVREYEVRIGLELGTEAHALKPSMRCEARLTLESVPEVVAVPVQAVFIEGPRQFVYAMAGERPEARPVTVGRRSDTLAEIVTGLEPGARVMLREPAGARTGAAPAGARAGNGGPAGQGARPSGRPGGARPGAPGAGAGGTVAPAGGAAAPASAPAAAPAPR